MNPNSNGFDPFQQFEEKPFDLRGFIFKYIVRYWYLYILFTMLAFTGAWLYLRYTIPKYETKAILMIKDENQNTGGGVSQESIIKDLGLLGGNKNIENEIQILKSRTMMEDVVRSLGIYAVFFAEGRVLNSELYEDCPVRLDSLDLNKTAYGKTCIIREKDSRSFLFEDGKIIETYAYSVPFTTTFGTLLMTKMDSLNFPENGSIILSISNPEEVAKGYAGRVSIKTVKEFSSVLELTLIDPEKKKSRDILNKLVEVYNRAEIEDKNRLSNNTLRFIEDRLISLTGDLKGVELDIEQYKTTRFIPLDVVESATRLGDEYMDLDKELARLDIQINILQSIEDYLKNQQNRFDLIPANLEVSNAAVSSLLNQFNTLLLERDRLLKSATSENPRAVILEEQLRSLKTAILQSIRENLQNLAMNRRQVEQKNRFANSRLKTAPKMQRELLEIARQQHIKESLYLYLLQKREETALSMAITTPNSRVIDPANTDALPVEPKKQLIYAMGLLLGIGIPALLIVLLDLLNDKIQSKEDIEKETAAPIIGGIGHSKSGKQIVVSKGSRSSIAEMFRLLRTNLQFIAADSGNKTILITSASSGEGKTFVTANLGVSMALADKKTVLVGLDLRKPKLTKYITGHPETSGITNYLAGNINIEDIILPTELSSNLFYIPSGPVPPNPAELLMSKRLDALMEHLKSAFDTILIDTPPVGLVADALLLNKHIDSTLFVVRSGKPGGDSWASLMIFTGTKN